MKRLVAIWLICVFVPCAYGETITYGGAKYVGEVLNGQPHGFGTSTWPDGDEYAGDWNFGKRHGFGIQTFGDGSRFVGEFRDNVMWQGKGYFPDGTFRGKSIQGVWHHGGFECETKREYIENGKNVIDCTFPNGERYVGEYKDDGAHGWGIHTWPNGRKYVGEWKNGLYHGQGAYSWPDGSEYTGEWEKDLYHGQGTYRFADGSSFDGEFKNQTRWSGTQYNPEGTAIGIFSDGQWIPY